MDRCMDVCVCGWMDGCICLATLNAYPMVLFMWLGLRDQGEVGLKVRIQVKNYS